MVKLFEKCSEIDRIFQKDIYQRSVKKHKIFLRGNENFYVYILIEKKNETDENVKKIEDEILEIYPSAEISFLYESDVEEDDFYKDIFSEATNNGNIHIEYGRRRFNTFLNKPVDKVRFERKNDSCPIVTFYSYKGGMGRSTTLAFFALHLAFKKRLKVFIIDADFEAPGFTNFFLKYPNEENQRNGLIEYIFDKKTKLTSKEYLERYTWEVDNTFIKNDFLDGKKGSIKIMPAGNLKSDFQNPSKDFLQYDMNHYLEALARINLVNQDAIMNTFTEVIQDIQDTFQPDVILIDSRTGFNDVMGVTAMQLSQIMVGFFRNDIQSLPGIKFFIDNAMQRMKYIEPYLINSILPHNISLKKNIFNDFKQKIQNITGTLQREDAEWDLEFPCFPLSKNENIEILKMQMTPYLFALL
ncbi:MAG: AAA family ATPase [Chitinophagaceae bacterium]|nr:AAA family ATPase [Chitinophagaceae bacterium]